MKKKVKHQWKTKSGEDEILKEQIEESEGRCRIEQCQENRHYRMIKMLKIEN